MKVSVNLRQPHLMVDDVVGHAEPVTENIGDQGAHRLVPRPVGERRDDLGKVLLPATW